MKEENFKKINNIIHRIKRQGNNLPKEALNNFAKVLKEVVESEEKNEKVSKIDGK